MEKLTCVDLRLFEGVSFISCFNFWHSPIEGFPMVRAGGRSSKLVNVVVEGILREWFFVLFIFVGTLEIFGDGVSGSLSELVSLGNNLLGDLWVGKPPIPLALGFSLVSMGGSSLRLGVHIVIEDFLMVALVILGVEVSWRGGVSGIVVFVCSIWGFNSLSIWSSHAEFCEVIPNAPSALLVIELEFILGDVSSHACSLSRLVSCDNDVTRSDKVSGFTRPPEPPVVPLALGFSLVAEDKEVRLFTFSISKRDSNEK
mgnify:FL=1